MNWERSTKSFNDKLMFNDKHIYPNDKSQALNQMSYALRTLSPESYKHLKTNVLQTQWTQCPWGHYEITLGHIILKMR